MGRAQAILKTLPIRITTTVLSALWVAGIGGLGRLGAGLGCVGNISAQPGVGASLACAMG